MNRILFVTILLISGLLCIGRGYCDIVTGDSSGPIWVKGTDGTRQYCYVVGSGSTKKVICHSY